MAGLLLLIGAPALAQVASLRTYGTADGLRSLGADCLVEDAQTNLWACTYGGLYRYEGERFERVGASAGLSDAYVMNVSPTADGRGLWVATAGNLYFWNGDTAARVLDGQGAGIPFTVGHNVAALDDGAIAVSKGHALRVSGRNGQWQVQRLFDAPTEATHRELQDLGAVYRDQSLLWFGCGQTICRRQADGQVRVYTEEDGVPADAWTSFLRDSHGVLWARSPQHILVLTPGAVRFVERPVPPPSVLATTTRHLDLTQDTQGRVLTRSDGGMLRWDGAWERLDTRNGLPDVPPNAMIADSKGELWMSYGGVGVMRWRGYSSVQNWGPANGLAGLPNWALARDAQGGMLFGNERDVFRLAPGGDRVARMTFNTDAPIRDVFALTLGPDKAVWVGLYRGDLLRVADGQTTLVTTLPHRLRRIYFDRRGRLWLCTTEGVYVIDDPAHPVAHRFTALPSVSFGDVEEDAQGRLWFAGKGAMMRLDGSTVTPIKIQGDVPNQLFDKLSIGTDGTVWVSVDDAGLFRGPVEAGDTLTLKAVDDPLIRDSLPYFIRHDRQGRLWVGGSMGVDVLQGTQWTRLNETNGLISEDISEGAFFEDPDGSVWVGSSRGISHVLHPDRLLAKAPVALRIERVERGGKRIAPGAILPWEQLPVRVTLNTPGSIAGPDMLRFRYRLRGRQDAWIETSSRVLDFPALGSGEQVVEVQAIDLARRAQSDVMSFSFELQPPWWRSVPALVLWTLLAMAVVTGVWRWRVGAIVARKRELERLVAARTAELEADKRALELARTALQVQATHDGLTGLRNRTSIMELLEKEAHRARTQGTTLAIALLDLDHFKQVNDTHGHLVGDAVLSGVADRLAHNMRGSDTIGRYGGEELLAVMPGLLPPAMQRLQALHDAVGARPLNVDGLSLVVTCSIGVAWLRDDETPTDLLRRADDGLYRAKREGRDRVVVDGVHDAASDGTPVLA
ncbi:ligand-binding sensor domain-containing diguanylate cyclase [Pseudoxanthomonas sp. GM95]|uniref:ligand-binding sensor domain-containing diguanylate cyclase n=1 Tax=Pseudoxanthomonas sp. GM95 TaxID=1881043 RepID=UPI0015875A17|nr:ligand-binding sensor domain-containing diguanylate cyclase [Pseudoxanthomonas sp. GM95]